MSAERPIIFSGPMVKAIMARTKTQTRRAVKFRCDGPVFEAHKHAPFADEPPNLLRFSFCHQAPASIRVEGPVSCPYGVPGDRLWVRETCDYFSGDEFELRKNRQTIYRADDGALPKANGRWCSPRFMPRWASRLLLEVTDVRVQRLQEISPEDCVAEGIEPEEELANWCVRLRPRFHALWDSINAKRAPWESNPWVWVVSFKRGEG